MRLFRVIFTRTKRFKTYANGSRFLPGFLPFVSAFAAYKTSNKPVDESYLKHVKYQTDTIIKSQQDKRSYRGIEMKNGMKILLVSDPATDKAAASLDVNVGSMSDPWNMPGVAHFCEHMLFLGTEKYPSDQEFHDFISAHAGSCNAYTSNDHTNYNFDVAPEYLEEGLDRLAQFLLCPLFSSDAVEREVNAVDSEHKKNVKSDNWRLNQLMRSIGDPKHDYYKFSTGSRKTLVKEAKANGLEPREELLKFHSRFYSSNVMAVCVIGKQTLDELASYVVPLMAEVEDRKTKRPEWSDHPYDPSKVGFRLNMVPIKDLRALNIIFPIPDLQTQYRTKPAGYICHLLNHEGPGSLFSELKNRGWINRLVSYNRTPARGFGFFNIFIALTDEGLEHWEEIIELLFGYIDFLAKFGSQEWIYNECTELMELAFRYKDKEGPRSYASSLARSLHDYPLEEILYGPYMMVEYTPVLIKSLMEKLSPRNMNIIIVSQRYAGTTDKKEAWYGTEYSLEPVSLMDRLEPKKVGTSKFKLPEKNDFLTSSLTVIGQRKKPGPLSDEPYRLFHTIPELFKNEQLMRIWFKQDDEFYAPKCCVLLHFRNPVVYADPLNRALASLYVLLLHDSLTEYTYSARLAGLNYSLSNGKYGITLRLDGYNEKQVVLLKKIVEHMRDFKVDTQRFEAVKEQYVRSLKNIEQRQPHSKASFCVSLLLSERKWAPNELLRELEGVNMGMLETFKRRFLSELFIEGLIHGNINKAGAEQLIKVVKDTLPTSAKAEPVFSSHYYHNREICLPNGTYYLFETVDQTHSQSALEAYFQMGVLEIRQNVLLELLAQIMEQPCFDQLRTKEQLGYLVFSGVRRESGTQGLFIAVQSNWPPEYLETRLEMFLTQIHKDLIKMGIKEFDTQKESLKLKKLERARGISDQATDYWTEIKAGTYDFDREYREVLELETVSKEDVLRFFEDMVAFTSKKRKKLSVYVHSAESKKFQKWLQAYQKSVDELHRAAGGDCVLQRAKKINDIMSFKLSLPLYWLPEPYIEVPNVL